MSTFIGFGVSETTIEPKGHNGVWPDKYPAKMWKGWSHQGKCQNLGYDSYCTCESGTYAMKDSTGTKAVCTNQYHIHDEVSCPAGTRVLKWENKIGDTVFQEGIHCGVIGECPTSHPWCETDGTCVRWGQTPGIDGWTGYGIRCTSHGQGSKAPSGQPDYSPRPAY